MATNRENSPVTVTQHFYDELHDFFLRSLKSILERVSSDSSILSSSSIPEISSRFDRIVNSYMTSEQALFMSYLLCNVIEIQKNSQSALPDFVIEFKTKYKELDKKYDKNGRLQKLLQAYRKNPSPNLIFQFSTFLPKFVGFYFDSTTIRSTLFDTRSLIVHFQKQFVKFISQSRKQVNEIISHYEKAPTEALEMCEKLKKQLLKQKNLRVTDSEKAREDLKKAEKALDHASKEIAKRDKFKLDIEGQIIRIIQNIETLSKNENVDPSAQITFTEIQKQGDQLRKILDSTKDENTQVFLTTSADASFQAISQELREKNQLILKLKEQIHSTSFKSSNGEATETSNKFEFDEDKVKLQYELSQTSKELQEQTLINNKLSSELQQKTESLRNYEHMKSEIEELQKENFALKEQAKQTAGFYETLNNENRKLSKANKTLKSHLDDANVRFDALYRHVERLQNKMLNQKNKLANYQKKEKVNSGPTLGLPTDSEIAVVKSGLLIEEINEAKDNIAQKDKTIAELEKDVVTKSQQVEYLTETERDSRARAELISKHMQKIQDLKLEQNEKLMEIQAKLSETTIQLDEKTNSLELTTRELSDQSSVLSQVETKYNETKEQNQILTTKLRKNKSQKVELTRQLDEINLIMKRKDAELVALRESCSSLSNSKKERDQFERDFLKLSNKFNQIQQNVQKLNEKIKELTDSNQKLTTELAKSKKLQNQMKIDAEKVQFDSQKSVIQVESEKNMLNLQIEELKQTNETLEQARLKAESIIESMRQERQQLETSIEARVQEMSETMNKKFSSLQTSHKLQKKELENRIELTDQQLIEARTKSSQLVSEIAKRKAEIATATAALQSFKSQFAKLLNTSESSSFIEEIRQLQQSIQSKTILINSLYEEIQKAKSKFGCKQSQVTNPLAQFAELVTFFETSFNQLQSIGQEKEIILSKEAQALKQVNIQSIDDIPGAFINLKNQIKDQKQDIDNMKRELEVVNSNHNNLLKNLANSLFFTREENLPAAAAQMKQELEQMKKDLNTQTKHHKDYVDNLRKILAFEDEDSLQNVLRVMKEERAAIQNRIEELEAELDKMAQIRDQTNSMISKIKKKTGIEDIETIPTAINQLKQEIKEKVSTINQLNKDHNNFVTQVSKSLSLRQVDEKALPETISQHRLQLEKLKQVYQDEVENHSTFIKKMKKITGCENDDEIPLITKRSFEQNEKQTEQVESLKQTLNSLQDKFDQLLQNVTSVVPIQDIQELPKTISRLQTSLQEKTSDFTELTQQHQALVTQLQEILMDRVMKSRVALTNESEKQLVNSFAELKSNDEKLKTEMKRQKDHLEKVNSSIQKSITFKDIDELPKLIHQMKFVSEQQKKENERLNEDNKQQHALLAKLHRQFATLASFSEISEVPEIMSEMKSNLQQVSTDYEDLMQRNESFIQDLSSLMRGKKDEHAILQTVEETINSNQSMQAELTSTKQMMKEHFDKMHSLVTFKNEKDLPVVVEKLVKSNETRAKELNDLVKEMKITQNMLNKFEHSMAESIKFKSIDEIPQIIHELKSNFTTKTSQLSEIQATHQQFVERISQAFDGNTKRKEKELPLLVMKLKEQQEKTQSELTKIQTHFNDILTDLHSVVRFRNETELPTIVQKMQATNQSIHNELEMMKSELQQKNSMINSLTDKFASLTEFDSLSEVPTEFAKMKEMLAKRTEDLKQQQESHQRFVSKICESLSLTMKEDQIPSNVLETKLAYEALKSKHSKYESETAEVFNELKKILNFTDERQLPKLVTGLMDALQEKQEENEILNERIEEVSENSQSFAQSLSSIVHFEDPEEAAQVLTEMRDKLDNKTEELDRMAQKHEHLVNQIYNLFKQSRKNATVDEIAEFLPDKVKELKETKEQVESEFKEAQQRMNEVSQAISQVKNIEEIPQLVNDQVEEIEKLKHAYQAQQEELNKYQTGFSSLITTSDIDEGFFQLQLMKQNSPRLKQLEIFKNKISEILKSSKDEDELVIQISQLKANEPRLRIIMKLQQLLNTSEDEQIPLSVERLSKSLEDTIQDLSAKKREISIINDRISKLEASFSAVMIYDQLESIPKIIKTTIDENTKIKNHHKNFVSTVLENMKGTRIKKMDEVSIPQAIIDLKQTNQALLETNMKNDMLMKSIEQHVEFKEPNEIPVIIQQLQIENQTLKLEIEDLNDYKSRLEGLKADCGLQDLSGLPKLLESLKNKSLEAEQLRNHHQEFLIQISQTIRDNKGKRVALEEDEIIDKISNFQKETKQQIDKLEQIKNDNEAIFKEIHSFVNYHENKDLPDVIKSLLKENEALERSRTDLKLAQNQLAILQQQCETQELDSVPKLMNEYRKQNEALQEEITELKGKHEDLVSKIHEIFGSRRRSEAELVSMINELKIANEKMNERLAVLPEIKRYIDYKNEGELPKMIKSMCESNKSLNSENEKLTLTCSTLSQQLSDLEKNFKSFLSYQEIEELPNIVSRMKSDLEENKSELNQLREKHNNFIQQLSSSLDNPAKKMEDDLVKLIQKTKEERDQLRIFSMKTNVALKNIDVKDIDDLDSYIKNLVEKAQDSQELIEYKSQISALESQFGEDAGEIPVIYNQVKDQLEKKSSEFDELNKKHIKFVESVKCALESTKTDEDDLAQLVATLKEKKTSLQEVVLHDESIFKSLHEVVDYQDDSDLPNLVYSNQVKLEELTAQTSSCLELLGVDTFRVVPSKINELQETIAKKNAQLDNLLNTHQNLVNQLCETLMIDDENQIEEAVESLVDVALVLPTQDPQVVQRMTEAQENLDELHEIVQFEDKDLPEFAENLKQVISFRSLNEIPIIVGELKQRHEKLITQIGESIQVESEESLPLQIQALTETLEKHQALMSQLHEIIEFSQPEDLPGAVKKICPNLRKIIKTMKSLLNVQKNNEIIPRLEEALKEHEYPNRVIVENIQKAVGSISVDDTVATVNQMKRQHYLLIQTLHKYISFDNEDEISDSLQKLILKQKMLEKYLDEASFFMINLLSYVGGDEKPNYNFKFPLEDEVARSILNSFISYMKMAEESLLQREEIIAAARIMGYEGNNAVEASNLLSRDLVKKKKVGILAKSNKEIEEIRKDYEKKLGFMEERLNQSAQLVQELRQAKISIIQANSRKLFEVSNELEQLTHENEALKKEIDQLNGNI